MVKKDVARWLVVLVTAVLTALVACGIDIAIESLSKFKYTWLQTCILPAGGAGVCVRDRLC